MERALVIDDSMAIRRILGTTLKKLGYEVSAAEDGQDALKRLDELGPPVDLILVDWNMPVMNGLNFVKNLRKDERFAASKVMMVTTETALEHVVDALEAGANEYVMKPFTTEIISDKLRLLGLR